MNVSIYGCERPVILTTRQESSERQADSGDDSLVQLPTTFQYFSELLSWLKIDSTSIPGQTEAERADYERRDILLLSCQNCASLLQRIKELEQRVLELEKELIGIR